MNVAVLSDIHGFSIALETVLRDIAEQSPIDAVVVAGDLCETGPDPRGVLELLWSFPEIVVIHGNTDRYLVDEARHGTDKPERQFTIGEIGQDGLDYLAGLPFSYRISPPGAGSPSDDLLVVHANPQNVEEALRPEFSDAELDAVIGETVAGALVFGHIHISYVRHLGSMLLVDVAAVGNPKDEDLRCRYGLLRWDEAQRSWSAEIRKLDYPLDETIEQIRSSGLPKPEKTIRKLIAASYRN